MQGGLLLPRAPVVHFFICDFGNAKVKTFSEQFINQLAQNGIRVYAERFMTHQPGFQVRAASINTTADFFFQIHSKTAGPGHVRLYVNGQPKRMTMDEALAEIWSSWRVRSGALCKEEIDLLSSERIFWLLSGFAGIDESNLRVEELQISIRDRITDGRDMHDVFDGLKEMEAVLLDGKAKIANCRPMNSEWIFEPGMQISRIVPAATCHGLSPPLKDRLSRMIDVYLKKTSALLNIVEKRLNAATTHPLVDDDMELETPIESPGYDTQVWRMLVESYPDDHIGSFRIASYGDNASAAQDVVSRNPAFLLDEFET
jgi:hypothetical protein